MGRTCRAGLDHRLRNQRKPIRAEPAPRTIPSTIKGSEEVELDEAAGAPVVVRVGNTVVLFSLVVVGGVGVGVWCGCGKYC